MKLTRLKYFIFYVILLVLPLSFVAIASYFIPPLNHLAFKTYYLYYGGMSLSLASLVIVVLTYSLIKSYFVDDKKIVDLKYILKINLIFIIFHILLTIISNILTYFRVPSYFNFAVYFIYPLIYFCIIMFLEYQKLNRRDAISSLVSIYILWYLLVPLGYFVINNVDLLYKAQTYKMLTYKLFYEYLKYSLLVMPFMSLGLIKISNEENAKSVVHKFNFSIRKLFLIAAILLFIAISVVIILNK